jgi:hypothetical protein
MRKRFRVGWATVTLLLLVASLVPLNGRSASAAGEVPSGPDRYTVVTEKYTSYEWWLTDWVDNKVDCSLNIDHEGMPTGQEIYDTCGSEVYDRWIITKACSQDDGCKGYYLQFIRSEPAERRVAKKLPPPVVWVTLEGCVPYRSTFRCDALPTLVLTGDEPLAGEHITGLAGNVVDNPFTCDPVCQLDLAPTGTDGLGIEFWALSSYGDSSEKFQARLRVVRSEDPSDQSWYVDVISSQWRGTTLAGCSQVWDLFPTIGGLPDWLSTPQRPEELSTSVPYVYLAAYLITQGAVDASVCVDGGLTSDGVASPCGMEVARPAVNEWQNRFDEFIFSAALETGVPAILLKSIFARESQFWPGKKIGHPEAGLGQMTDGGADVLLMWNPSFYEQFCPSVLDETTCKKKIYPQPEDEWKGIGLDEVERTLLRSALVQSVDAVCPDCSLGIDLDKAGVSVGVFAQTLVASCKQTAMIIDMNYDIPANQAASYEDLWRFTLVNYNAGPGCLGLAVDKTNVAGEAMDWEHLSSHFTPVCQGAFNYVDDISRTSTTP